MPFSKKSVARLVVAIPLLPVTLTIVPIEQVIDRALKLIL
jgi:hypothetical protein